MKITPLEIRQKTFEKNLRGYDKDEVHAFLNSLSQEWERTLDEWKASRMRLENTEKEVSKLREVETTLYKTLKTAEDTGAHVIEQANKQAELHLREAQLQADAMLADARTKARQLIEEAERRAQQLTGELEHRLRELTQQFRDALQHRDVLSGDLARLAQDLLDRAERLRRSADGFPADAVIGQIRVSASSAIADSSPHPSNSSAASGQSEPTPAPPQKPRSFFDEIG